MFGCDRGRDRVRTVRYSVRVRIYATASVTVSVLLYRVRDSIHVCDNVRFRESVRDSIRE